MSTETGFEIVTKQPSQWASCKENVETSNRSVHDNDNVQSFLKISEGVKILKASDEIEFCQEINACELVGCSRSGSYKIYTPGSTKHFFHLYEVSDCMARQCLGAGRGFVGKVKDVDDAYIASVNRSLTFSRGCFCSCKTPSMTVCFPIPFQIGTIVERSTCLRPTFNILDAKGEQLFFFTNDCCYLQKCLWFMDVAISIFDTKGNLAAKIIKKTYKNAEEFFGFENKFIVKFIEELDVKYKILVLGACLMINLNNFEHDKRLCC